MNLLNEAIALHKSGRLAEAATVYRKVLHHSPDEPNALRLLGLVEFQTGQLDIAEKLFARAIKSNPKSPDSHYFMGRLALAKYDHASAERHFTSTIRLDPRHLDALICLGNLSLKVNSLAALDFFGRALAIDPSAIDAQLGQGQSLINLGRYGEALIAYDAVIRMRRDIAAAWHGRGNALLHLNRYDDALAAQDTAIALDPNNAEAWNGRGHALLAKKMFAEAVSAYDRAIAIQPELPFAAGFRLHARMHACDWSDIAEDWDGLRARIDAGDLPVTPFPLLSMPLKAEYQLRCASDCVNSGKFGTWTSAPAAPRTLGDQRIRVAYVSSDFADHPVSFLMAGVFEHHDRARFDITAVSLNPDPPRTSGYRERIKAAADQFILGSDKTDTEIVQSLRRGGCDIAIDLNGFTIGHRLGIFGARAAPIQVNYLGFPGTMGARFIDYILADEFTIPRELQHLYSEKVVYLPEVFQANDSGRKISDRVPSRSDLGLPPTGFVFASLNAPYKITPQIFDVWMRVLKQVDGGVLLLQGGPSERNLRTEAERRGVAGGRLVFASWAPYPEYLARYKVADLFLDTMPFSGGTTTSDALWAGLPVLTLPGDAFASRMSGSLLRAADLPELIAGSPEEYEAIAVRLARDPELLAATKAKLNRNRRGGPLFDTARFTAHLETAFSMMCDRHRRGEHPESFSVLTR